MKDEDICKIAESIVDNKNLKLWCLDLSGNTAGIGPKSAEALRRMLVGNTYLRVLNLSNTGLQENTLSLIAQGLKYNTKLRILMLNNNNITASSMGGVEKFVVAIGENPASGLEGFSFAKNPFGAAGIKMLAQALCQVPISKLVVELAEVARGGTGALDGIPPLVEPEVDAKAKAASGGVDELPGPRSSCPGVGQGREAALDHRQEDGVLGEALLSEDVLHHRDVPRGPRQIVAKYLRPEPWKNWIHWATLGRISTGMSYSQRALAIYPTRLAHFTVRGTIFTAPGEVPRAIHSSPRQLCPRAAPGTCGSHTALRFRPRRSPLSVLRCSG